MSTAAPTAPPTAPAPTVTFADWVEHELVMSRQLWPQMTRHLEAAGVIREEFEEFWRLVQARPSRGRFAGLLMELRQVAAMCWRAAEDLDLMPPQNGVARRFWDLVVVAARMQRQCLWTPLQTPHAAATWLRFALDKYERGVEIGLGRQAPLMLLGALVDLAARCQVVVEDLNIIARAGQLYCAVCHAAVSLDAWCHGCGNYLCETCAGDMERLPIGRTHLITAHAPVLAVSARPMPAAGECRCATHRRETPPACPLHGALTTENA